MSTLHGSSSAFATLFQNPVQDRTEAIHTPAVPPKLEEKKPKEPRGPVYVKPVLITLPETRKKLREQKLKKEQKKAKNTKKPTQRKAKKILKKVKPSAKKKTAKKLPAKKNVVKKRR